MMIGREFHLLVFVLINFLCWENNAHMAKNRWWKQDKTKCQFPFLYPSRNSYGCTYLYNNFLIQIWVSYTHFCFSVPCLFVSYLCNYCDCIFFTNWSIVIFFTNWSIEIYKVLIYGIQTKWFSYTYKHASTQMHIFFSSVGYYKILNIVPCAIQCDLVVYFIQNTVYLLISNS